MKKIILFLMINLPLLFMAQTPETVYSIVDVVKDYDWYEQQAKAWKKVLDNEPKNAEAWVNFYTANRMAEIEDAKKWQENQKDYYLPLNTILEMAEKNIPNTFEAYYLSAYNNRFQTDDETALLKAQNLRPYDRRLLPQLLKHYQMKRDIENVNLVSKKWFESNAMSPGILNTAYNILASTDKNAILFVYGDNDTYPTWLLQNAQNIRKDVLVLSVSLLTLNTYREKLFKENNIPELKNIDNTNSSEQIVSHIIENVKSRPIYVSGFAPSDLYKRYENKMYLTGLTFKYSDKSFDNLAVLRNNFENKFLTDYLIESFTNDLSKSVVDRMKGGYFAVLYKLYESYKWSGETQKLQKTKELAQRVADACQNQEWMKYFEK